MTTRQISNLCFVLDHSHVEGNLGAVRGKVGTVVVDAGPSFDEGLAARRALETNRHSMAGLILTHGHFDHAFGAGAFADVDLIGHRLTRSVVEEEIRRQTNQPANQLANRVDQSGGPIRVPHPTKVLEADYEMDLGGATASVLLTPGHSPDSLSVFCREDGVLFTGDTVVTCIPPVFKDGSSGALLATYQSLVALEPSVLVPGHGPMLEGIEVIKDHLNWSAAYVVEARRLVAGAIENGQLDIEETARLLDTRTGNRFLMEVHDMAWRHRLTVETVRREFESHTKS